MKYKVVTYIRADEEDEVLYDSKEEAEKSYNEDDETIYIIEEVKE
jgi:predicted small metal-binding protein